MRPSRSIINLFPFFLSSIIKPPPIERDGRITVLYGNMSKDNLHFYDMREARDIEMRVKRKFGPSHPYANYKKFLKGVRESYIKTFDEFTDNE